MEIFIFCFILFIIAVITVELSFLLVTQYILAKKMRLKINITNIELRKEKDMLIKSAQNTVNYNISNAFNIFKWNRRLKMSWYTNKELSKFIKDNKVPNRNIW